MRLSKTVRESMIMNGNRNPPAKPQTKEFKERERKDRNKRKAANKIVYRFDYPEGTVRVNPKKVKSARRARPQNWKAKMGQYVFKYHSSNEYNPHECRRQGKR